MRFEARATSLLRPNATGRWAGDTSKIGRLYALFRGWDLVLALASVIAFVVALVTGLGIESLAFLGAGIWSMLFSRYWAKKARAAQRHRELRDRRLERERRGLAPPRS